MSVKEKETSTGKGGQEGISWVESIVWGTSELLEESLADSCFSFNKIHQTRNFALFEIVMTQILHQKYSPHFLKTNLAEIKARLQILLCGFCS